MNPDPWFKQGLRFGCTGCGKCCTGSPGYVFLSERDLEALSNHFQISSDEFIRKYCRRSEGQLCLIDTPGTDACIFLKNNQCTAYGARPVQCRTFPWWIHNLNTPEDWQEAAKRCEGINHPDAPLVDSDTIGAECMTYLDNLLEQHFS